MAKYQCKKCGVTFNHFINALMCHPNITEIEEGDESTRKRRTTIGADETTPKACEDIFHVWQIEDTSHKYCCECGVRLLP